MNVSSHSSERKPSERANKQPTFDVYDSENAAFQNQQPNNNVEWTVLISAACSVMCWHLFSFIPNITFPFGSQCFFYVCVCVCWCSMTMRHLTSRIPTLLCSRKRDKKAKKKWPDKKQEFEMLWIVLLFFPLLNQHLNMGFYAEQTRPNTFLILFASFLSLNVCFCFYHFAYSQLLAAIRLFVLCFVDNCCETLLWIIQ